MKKLFVLGMLVLGFMGVELATSDGLHAQQATFKRTVLQKVDLADLPGKESVMVLGEFPPGVQSGRHTHLGTELVH